MKLCDRIAIIDQGKIIALDTPEGLKKLVKKDTIVEVKVKNYTGNNPFGLVKVEENNGTIVLRGSLGEEEIPRLVEFLVRNNAKVLSVEVKEPTLEDVFIKLTGRGLRD